jgi:ABC-type transport system involved in multi-copper enzyme maturation permease subunit
MATTTTPNVRLSALPPAVGRAGLRGALASEFTKLRSVRSTYWTLGALFIVSVGLGVAIAFGTSASWDTHPFQKVDFDATQTSLGVFFEIGQLIIAVLGAMVITSEYSTGMIRTSLTAQPRRSVVYAAKAIAFTSVTLVISLITAFIAFFAVMAVYASTGVGVSLFHNARIPAQANMNCLQRVQIGPSEFRCTHGSLVVTSWDTIHPSTVLAAIIGTALFVTLVALIAYGVGALVRHTAGAIAIVIALMFIIPILENALPSNWHNDIMRFLPDAANMVVSVTIPGNNNAHLWSAWPQLGVTALWAAVLIGVGAYLFRHRDA